MYGLAAVLPGITPPVAIKGPEEESAGEGEIMGGAEPPILSPIAFLKVNCTPPPLLFVEAAIIDEVIAFGTDRPAAANPNPTPLPAAAKNPLTCWPDPGPFPPPKFAINYKNGHDTHTRMGQRKYYTENGSR